MFGFIQIVDPANGLQLFGIRQVGINAENAKKVLFTIVFVSAVWLLHRGMHFLADHIYAKKGLRIQFWRRQAAQVISTGLLVIGLVSIWLDDASRLGSAAACITAGWRWRLSA